MNRGSVSTIPIGTNESTPIHTHWDQVICVHTYYISLFLHIYWLCMDSIMHEIMYSQPVRWRSIVITSAMFKVPIHRDRASSLYALQFLVSSLDLSTAPFTTLLYLYVHVSILHVTNLYYVSILYMSAPLICHTPRCHPVYGPAYVFLLNKIFAGMFPRLPCVCAEIYIFCTQAENTFKTSALYRWVKIICTEHSHSSASPCLLHVVVMCPPHQHVHPEMQ